jgi:hypothetical protein
MRTRFLRAHDVLHAHGVNDRGRRFAMENGVHPERRRKTELAMAEGLTKLTKNLKQKNERRRRK